jgi:hypothetical protein
MKFEFDWKDYRRFGPDAASDTLSRLFTKRLPGSYSEKIETIILCGHCRAVFMPKGNLEQLALNFEEHLVTLREKPKMSLSTKEKELTVAYATVWPTADEFNPDSDILRFGTFSRLYRKSITLLEGVAAEPRLKDVVDFPRLLTDIKLLEPLLPMNLHQLAKLYVELTSDPSNKREKEK